MSGSGPRPICACTNCTNFSLHCSKYKGVEIGEGDADNATKCEPDCAACVVGECSDLHVECPGYHTNYVGRYHYNCPIHSIQKLKRITGLVIATINLDHGLLYHERLEEIETLLLKSGCNIDILGVVGTQIQVTDIDSEEKKKSFDIEGYDFIPHLNIPPNYSGKGGIGLYVKSGIFEVSFLIDDDDDENEAQGQNQMREYFDQDSIHCELFFIKPRQEDHQNILSVFCLVLLYNRHPGHTLEIRKAIEITQPIPVPFFMMGEFNCKCEKRLRTQNFNWTPNIRETFCGMNIESGTYTPKRKNTKSVTLSNLIMTHGLKPGYGMSGNVHQNFLPFKTSHPMLYVTLPLPPQPQDAADTKGERETDVEPVFKNKCLFCSLNLDLLLNDLEDNCTDPEHHRLALASLTKKSLRIGYVRKWLNSRELEDPELLKELGHRVSQNNMFDILVIISSYEHKDRDADEIKIDVPAKFTIVKKNGYVIYIKLKDGVTVSVQSAAPSPDDDESENIATSKLLMLPEMKAAGKDGLLFNEMMYLSIIDLYAWEDKESLEESGEIKYLLSSLGYKPIGRPEFEEMRKSPIIFTMFANSEKKYQGQGIFPSPVDHSELIPTPRSPILFLTREITDCTLELDIFVSKSPLYGILFSFNEISNVDKIRYETQV